MPNIAPETAVHVAVGIFLNRDQVFITRRDSNVHQGGKWEFPGGKCNPGEPVLAALKRELHEELGIEVESAIPWTQVHHVYSDREVLLDVWQITAWRGDPHGREGQEVRWCSIRNLPALDFPEADLPILRRLWLPSLYLISDATRFGKEKFLEMLERTLKAGARLIQQREPSMSQPEFRAYAGTVAALCHRYGARLLLSADPAVVEECGARRRANSRRLMALDRRPLGNALFVAASCHNREELRQAVRLGMDFAVLSPVAATASHPGIVPLGWDKFRALCGSVPLPIYALGGMRPGDHLGVARNAGARGIATVSGIWSAANIEVAVTTCADQIFPAADAKAR